ncbi:MAG TPA: response regulator [Polyangiaceae bacterium]|jgi:CheY-like chemotaxis protein
MAHVVVVEDSDDFRDALCDMLFEAGFDAVAVSTAAEAKALLNRHPLRCIVLLDLGLPDDRGENVLEWIRSHPHHRDNPIIVMTAMQKDSVPGCNALLAKPIDFDALLKLIDRHIARLPN